LIVGGGVIGCEFASLFSALGSQVTVAEKLPQLLPGIDKEVAQKLENIYKRKGIKVMTNTEASTLDLNAYELVLVCVGRTPDFSVPGLGVLGVTVEHKRISVDATLRTSIPNIYAAGDCTGQVLLAHFAAYQGGVAAWNIARPDNPQKADASAIPNCIFTDPEIAAVGITEAHAAASGIEPVIHRFDFLGSGMARILDETEGFMKIVSDNRTGRLIGGVIIGPRATELISTLTLAVSAGLKIPQLKNTIFAHPTLSESIHDALS
jgi:dihydrolipoamide dehydrogenase